MYRKIPGTVGTRGQSPETKLIAIFIWGGKEIYEQWSQVVEEAHEIRDRYGGARMAEYIMLGVIQNLEEQERKLKGEIQNSGGKDNGRINETN